MLLSEYQKVKITPFESKSSWVKGDPFYSGNIRAVREIGPKEIAGKTFSVEIWRTEMAFSVEIDIPLRVEVSKTRPSGKRVLQGSERSRGWISRGLV
jgi:hypothetical protein